MAADVESVTYTCINMQGVTSLRAFGYVYVHVHMYI